jgi:hypothetical protein
MDERDWTVFACPNRRCSAFGQRGLSSIRPHEASGTCRCLTSG